MLKRTICKMKKRVMADVTAAPARSLSRKLIDATSGEKMAAAAGLKKTNMKAIEQRYLYRTNNLDDIAITKMLKKIVKFQAKQRPSPDEHLHQALLCFEVPPDQIERVLTHGLEFPFSSDVTKDSFKSPTLGASDSTIFALSLIFDYPSAFAWVDKNAGFSNFCAMLADTTSLTEEEITTHAHLYWKLLSHAEHAVFED
eukprot:TRINITY_DN10437_c4_g1_i1.p1 TRINITY_DN10437_c4_g1~~TRINITY_DN10437_c4_g1_i1.p1  ORF type:complete len:214 (+),score=44.63 TRINITY_DN10437_c4_g1_i1:46-642(+)